MTIIRLIIIKIMTSIILIMKMITNKIQRINNNNQAVCSTITNDNNNNYNNNEINIYNTVLIIK